jgi:hypothetical protein
MTPLERRCGWLLLAYPAAYRHARGEEILGTLLESTPADRGWPLPCDCRTMIVGGLQVRAAQNRHLTTAANLRLAATLGCVLYLSYFFYSFAGLPLLYLGAGMGAQTQSYPLVAFAAGLLACTVLLVVRPGGRSSAVATIVAVAALIGGTAAVAISEPVTESAAGILPVLLVLAALAVVSRGAERLPRLWLWFPGLVVTVALLAPVASLLRSGVDYFHLLRGDLYILGVTAFLAFVWIVIDARPAVGVAIFLGLTASERLISVWQAYGSFASAASGPMHDMAGRLILAASWSLAWRLFAAGLVLAVLSSRRLRRQAAL